MPYGSSSEQNIGEQPSGELIRLPWSMEARQNEHRKDQTEVA
jgi:hypothetical protein